MIGQRLKLARAAAGLSLRDLQAQIGNRVTAQAIGKYERNESMPSSGVLIALCAALGVTEDYLLGDQELVLEGVEFRKKTITSQREEAQVQAQVLHLFERYLMVEELLGLSVEWDKPREAPYPIHNENEAENAAAGLRAHWGLGSDPIPSLVELLEERGIKVLSIKADKIDGLTAQVRRPNRPGLPVIVINSTDWGERKRFNLAHELGHMVVEVGQHVDAERVAHRFAGAFLMPADALRGEVGKHRTSISLAELARLKKIFGASFQAITYRCKDLGIFSDALFRTLFNEFTRRGWRSPPYQEAGALPAKLEEPSRLKALCYRAVAEGAISESRAAELLGISVHELNRRMDDPEAEGNVAEA